VLRKFVVLKLTNHFGAIPMSKDKYKVMNWKEYNQGLINRGRIDVWIDSEEIEKWNEPERSGKAGRPKEYSDSAILLCVVVRKLYHLSLRSCQGFMISIFELMHLCLKVPCYTQISRRSANLEVPLGALPRQGEINIAIDSTGLKVYGEGEWKVRKHGWTKHRRWMKLHLVLDTETQQIVAADLTSNAVDDGQMAAPMLESKEGEGQPLKGRVRSIAGDTAYDKEKVRKPLAGIIQLIPPQHNGKVHGSKKPFYAQRDQAITEIEQIGRAEWKKKAGYHKRSLSETGMFRYKTIIGDDLQARKPVTQKTEVLAGVRILNRMLQMAKPISYKAA
jgi:Transposase DDE domain